MSVRVERRGASAVVTLDRPAQRNALSRDAVLELTVTNALPAGPSPRWDQGHGLIGMRERASLVAGSLDIDRADGVFRVRARIPYGGSRS